MDENKSETLFDELMTILLKLDDFREYNLELFSKIELHNYDQFVDGLNKAINQSKFLIERICKKRASL